MSFEQEVEISLRCRFPLLSVSSRWRTETKEPS